MKNKAKKITLNNLSGKVDNISEKVDKVSSSMETGFTRMGKGFNKLNQDIESLARMTSKGFENTKADVEVLQGDVSDIKLRLDNMAPKFEVRALEKRVVRLEQKTGIRHST